MRAQRSRFSLIKSSELIPSPLFLVFLALILPRSCHSDVVPASPTACSEPLPPGAIAAEKFLQVASCGGGPEDAQYPRNVSDTFKGSWTAEGELPLGFEKLAGHVLFQIVNSETAAPDVDIVKGELVLRDGEYSTNENMHFLLQGIYFWRVGVLFLLANPLREPVIQNFDLVLEKGVPLAEILRRTSEFDQKHITAVNGSSGVAAPPSGSCYFKLLLRALPLPPGAPNPKLREPTRSARPVSATSGTESSHRAATQFRGAMFSPVCGTYLTTEFDALEADVYFRKAINYVLLVTFFSMLQISFLIRQLDAGSSPAVLTKVSLLTIGLQTVMDSYQVIIHLTTGVVLEPAFNAFATAAFFKFVTFSAFEMRYLLMIWKARRPQAFSDGWEAVRRELSLLYARFYGFLMAGFLILYFADGVFPLFVLLLYSYWLPQIVCNATRDTNRALLKQYVVGMTVTRLLDPLYFYACPRNFIHAEPNPLVWFLVAWQVLQVTVLFAQDRFGPRFFVPKRFLPVKFDYGRALPDGDQAPECVICMSQIEIRKHMITPCNHVFCSDCLRTWMDEKLECPTCRGVLPLP